jgi:hypothetical protein
MKTNFLKLLFVLAIVVSTNGCSDTTETIGDTVFNDTTKAPLVLLQDRNQVSLAYAADLGHFMKSENNKNQIRLNYYSFNTNIVSHEIYVSKVNFPTVAQGALNLTNLPTTARLLRTITSLPSEQIITRQQIGDALGENPASWPNSQTIFFFGKSTDSQGKVTFNQWKLERWTRREAAHTYLYRWRVNID